MLPILYFFNKSIRIRLQSTSKSADVQAGINRGGLQTRVVEHLLNHG